jgi:hypothetical protein
MGLFILEDGYPWFKAPLSVFGLELLACKLTAQRKVITNERKVKLRDKLGVDTRLVWCGTEP